MTIEPAFAEVAVDAFGESILGQFCRFDKALLDAESSPLRQTFLESGAPRF